MSEAKRFDDLPEPTKKFLSNLRENEIDTLNEGIRLIVAIRTVGKFVKIIILGLLGILAGLMMVGESFSKIVMWFRGG